LVKIKAAAIGRQRELVEFYCALRPELVDALWKSDVEWKTKNRLHTAQKDFVVTTNNSFYRPELLAFIKKVHRYKTKKKKCILVPCSADKPYPSELHKIIKKIAGEDWLIIVVSGAIGLAPEELFKDMPNYDSGLPYFWRIRDEVQKFFKRNKFEKIVVYSDFNSAAIKAGLDVLKQNATYVFGTRIREYQNLKSQKNLKKLATALKS
jgi:predicted RNA-binding protein